MRLYRWMGPIALAAAAAVVARIAVVGAPQPAAIAWEPVGLSGGGAMYTPAISPADPRRMMIDCDMSGAYVSTDGGRTWRMINHAELHSNTGCRPAFHPTDPLTVYAADGWSGLKVSHDGGIHWQRAADGSLPGDLRGDIAIDPGAPSRMLAGAGEAVYRSSDAGAHWVRCEGPHGAPMAYCFDQNTAADRRTCFAATNEGIWRSRDGGATWQPATAGLPAGAILGFAGGSSRSTGETIMYCSVPSEVRAGRLAGGIFRSTNRGDTWQPAMGAGLNVDIAAYDQWAMGPVAQYRHVATSDADPRVVYAFNTNTGIPPPHHASVYRSDDAGKTWHATFQPDPRYLGLNVELDYTASEDGQFYQDVPTPALDPQDPRKMLAVLEGEAYATVDGGASWQSCHTRCDPRDDPRKPGARWLCTGLVVTTTWNYFVDPFEPNRHYICYTDIGFARSEDRGKTWRWWAAGGRPPWRNTCYQLAFDPGTAGKIWGAFSDVHDIPNANIVFNRHSTRYPGGVALSTDYGATWKLSNAGLPPAPVTSVVVDPRSAVGSRTMYAGAFGHGVYRSTDDGRTWTRRSEGLGSTANMRVDRVALHRDGSLFALITGLRVGKEFQTDGVGLYRSRDGGGRWELVNRSQPLLWPKDFTVDPADSRTIYLSACDANGKPEAGLYRTMDGGATWRQLARKGPEHFGAYLHPRHPGWIYMTLTEDAPDAGLWLSKDNGATWQPMNGLPFSNAQRVAFDAADPDAIYVATFGGSVWRGPAAETR